MMNKGKFNNFIFKYLVESLRQGYQDISFLTDETDGKKRKQQVINNVKGLMNFKFYDEFANSKEIFDSIYGDLSRLIYQLMVDNDTKNSVCSMLASQIFLYDFKGNRSVEEKHFWFSLFCSLLRTSIKNERYELLKQIKYKLNTFSYGSKGKNSFSSCTMAFITMYLFYCMQYTSRISDDKKRILKSIYYDDEIFENTMFNSMDKTISRLFADFNVDLKTYVVMITGMKTCTMLHIQLKLILYLHWTGLWAVFFIIRHLI